MKGSSVEFETIFYVRLLSHTYTHTADSTSKTDKSKFSPPPPPSLISLRPPHYRPACELTSNFSAFQGPRGGDTCIISMTFELVHFWSIVPYRAMLTIERENKRGKRRVLGTTRLVFWTSLLSFDLYYLFLGGWLLGVGPSGI